MKQLLALSSQLSVLRRTRPVFWLQAVLCAILVLAVSASADVLRIVVNDAIQPVTAEYIGRALDDAAAHRAQAVLIEINTPGGLVDSTRDIIEKIVASPVPVIIYDVRLPGVDWTQAFDALSQLPNRPRLLLAAQAVDESLWREVLRRHGYDVVYRSAGSEELRRALRFAWLSLSALSPHKLTR